MSYEDRMEIQREIIENIKSWDDDDKRDLSELVQCFHESPDDEELDSIARAITEMVYPPSLEPKIQRMF